MAKAVCDICGGEKGACNSPHRGGGLTVTRLNRAEENKAMATIQVSKHRYYLTKDKTRAVRKGDPEADVLLVGKGGAVIPEVIEKYNLETEDGESVIRVERSAEETRAAMVTEGTTGTKDNYDRMKVERETYESAKTSVQNPHNAGGSMQASLMAQGAVNEKFGERNRLTQIAEDDKAKDRLSEMGANEQGLSPLREKSEDGEETGQAPSKDANFSPRPMEERAANTRTKTIGGEQTQTAEAAKNSETKDGETTPPVTGTPNNEHEKALKDALNGEDLKQGGENSQDKEAAAANESLQEKKEDLEKDLNNPNLQDVITPPKV